MTKFYRDIQTHLFYIHAGYDVKRNFRSEVIVEKTVENAASDGFRWNLSKPVSASIMKFYILIGAIGPTNQPAVAGCLRSAAKCN